MSILDRIVEDTRARLEASKQRTSVSMLKDARYFQGPTLSLEDAIARPGLQFICEIKKASPSRGTIRKQFDVADLALDYRHAGAAALSVLTEPTWFKGSLGHLETARAAVDIPILRKDFIVDEYQLFEARASGADAVLLIAAILERTELFDLHARANELGLSCLVEIYHPSELDRVNFDQVNILGVNNRDLHTFEVDVRHALRVFSDVPAGILRVSESGLNTLADFTLVQEHGIDAALVGETFMRAPSPGEKLAEVTNALSRFPVTT